MSSISDEIDQAFEEAQLAHGRAPLDRLAEDHPVLAGMSAADLIDVAVNDRVAPFVRDQVWVAVIDGYRQGPTAFWGPLVLKAIVPTLLPKAARLPQEPEFEADINHQLIAGVLHAAATGKLPSPARWTPNRLATRAVTRTRRWMAKEARARGVYLDELPEAEAGPDPDPDEFASMLVLLRGWGLDEEGSILLLRNRVLGEPLAEIAEQLGMTGLRRRAVPRMHAGSGTKERDFTTKGAAWPPEFSGRSTGAQRALNGRSTGAKAVRFGLLDGDLVYVKHRKPSRKLTLPLSATALAALLLILLAAPAYAASADLNPVIDSIRNWIAGLLAALATLFLTVGGLRYLTANGNPRAYEQAKESIKSALVGYALAALAPLLVEVFRQVLKV